MGGERKGLTLAREVLKALGQTGKQQNHKQPNLPRKSACWKWPEPEHQAALGSLSPSSGGDGSCAFRKLGK